MPSINSTADFLFVGADSPSSTIELSIDRVARSATALGLPSRRILHSRIRPKQRRSAP
jgi:hypothetical protein